MRIKPKSKNMLSQQSHNLTTFNFEDVNNDNSFFSKKLEKKPNKSMNFSKRDFPQTPNNERSSKRINEEKNISSKKSLHSFNDKGG